MFLSRCSCIFSGSSLATCRTHLFANSEIQMKFRTSSKEYYRSLKGVNGLLEKNKYYGLHIYLGGRSWASVLETQESRKTLKVVLHTMNFLQAMIQLAMDLKACITSVKHKLDVAFLILQEGEISYFYQDLLQNLQRKEASFCLKCVWFKSFILIC